MSYPVCVALAAGSLLVSATPGFDAWGWALWGRELTGDGKFSTASYPSWKPLPALVDTVWSAVVEASLTATIEDRSNE